MNHISDLIVIIVVLTLFTFPNILNSTIFSCTLIITRHTIDVSLFRLCLFPNSLLIRSRAAHVTILPLLHTFSLPHHFSPYILSITLLISFLSAFRLHIQYSTFLFCFHNFHRFLGWWAFSFCECMSNTSSRVRLLIAILVGVSKGWKCCRMRRRWMTVTRLLQGRERQRQKRSFHSHAEVERGFGMEIEDDSFHCVFCVNQETTSQ